MNEEYEETNRKIKEKEEESRGGRRSTRRGLYSAEEPEELMSLPISTRKTRSARKAE